MHYNFDDGTFANVGYGNTSWGAGTLGVGKIINMPSRKTKGIACKHQDQSVGQPCFHPFDVSEAKCLR